MPKEVLSPSSNFSQYSSLAVLPSLFLSGVLLAQKRDTAKYSSVSNPSSLTHGQAIADISQHRSGGVLFQAGVL